MAAVPSPTAGGALISGLPRGRAPWPPSSRGVQLAGAWAQPRGEGVGSEFAPGFPCVSPVCYRCVSRVSRVVAAWLPHGWRVCIQSGLGGIRRHSCMKRLPFRQELAFHALVGACAREAFHSVRCCSGEIRDAVESVPTGGGHASISVSRRQMANRRCGLGGRLKLSRMRG